MYWKNAFINTLREDPAEAELISHKLMIRAGMIQKVAAGIYNYLPLGLRVLRKIEGIIREELGRCGAAELLMPAVIPAELWKESGRWNYYGPELLRFTDRKNNHFCFGPTHEEVVVDIARHAIRSYRDLPVCLYQIQDKFRDEIRPRFGLMRGREFIMKDAYSFHGDEASLDEMYWKMHEAYTNIFQRSGLAFRPVEADSGTIGGDVTHEFHVLADSGEDTIVYCDTCEYAANIEKAESRNQFTVSEVPADARQPEEVATPGKKNIEEVTDFLGVKPSETVKTLIYSVDDGEYFIAACIRGDRELNETKLRNLLGADSVTIPDDTLVRTATDAPIGFLGAYKLDRKGLREVIADHSVASMADCVVGANKEDYHIHHIYPARDLDVDRYADIGFACAGEGCPRCAAGTLQLRKGIEVGQIFKLGTKYSQPMGLTFLTEKGAPQPVIMGCYGIGIGRTAAAAVEQNNDKDGIIWPIEIAPYTIALVCLDMANPEVEHIASAIHDDCEKRGIEIIFDNRDERPGVKFKDVDLIGFPLRVVVGRKGIKDGVVEIKRRVESTAVKVPVDNTVAYLTDMIKTLHRER